MTAPHNPAFRPEMVLRETRVGLRESEVCSRCKACADYVLRCPNFSHVPYILPRVAPVVAVVRFRTTARRWGAVSQVPRVPGLAPVDQVRVELGIQRVSFLMQVRRIRGGCEKRSHSAVGKV